MPTVALIVTDLSQSWLGLPSRLLERLNEETVLQRTVQRAARVNAVERIILVHPAGQNPDQHVSEAGLDKPVTCFPVEGGLTDPYLPHWQAARKWALTCWRGGLGESPVWDELLPAGPLAAALAAYKAEAGLVVRAEWCLFDPALGQAQLEKHLESPEGLSLTFTQAPPGLSPLVIGRPVLEQMSEHHASFGSILGYNALYPRMDPISRDANIPIPASVRDCHRRFIYETPRSMTLIDAIADHLGPELDEADATAITDAARAVESAGLAPGSGWLPQQATLELTPRREVAGPITPQGHVTFERADLDPAVAREVFQELGAVGDVAVTLGGLGDALLHPDWAHLVQAGRDAGLLGIGIETDLLCSREALERMLALPLDLVHVRLNADRVATYQEAMGVDRFSEVMANLQYLLEQRDQTVDDKNREPGRPWLVLSLAKTDATLEDLESFFERWSRGLGCHPVIAPAATGCGQMPAMEPVAMQPPRRTPCRQLGSRLTILADGTVALCDQDWQGRAALGRVGERSLPAIWRGVAPVQAAHHEGRYAELAICGECDQWHRP